MKLLITGAWNYTDNDIRQLELLGYNCVFHQSEKEPLSQNCFDVDGVICNGLFLYNDAGAFHNLKFVQLTSAGLDRIPIEYFKKKKIKVFNAAGVYSTPIAEFVLSSILDLYKRKFVFYENQKKQIWAKQRDLLELNGKTICIVGCGNVGSACAKLFKAFGCFVLGVDLIPFDSNLFDSVVSIKDIKDHIGKADVVVLTLPLTEDTRNLFDISMFTQMKRSSILINVARGGIVNNDDLSQALNKKLITAAILDVFETEPLSSESPLWNMDNLIIYPHNSYVGDGNNARLAKLIKHNLEGQL